jgi:protein-S-isoprenylcysteine O-methyltransferase Ste14
MADPEDNSHGGERRFLRAGAGVVAGLVPCWLTGWRAGSLYPVPGRIAGTVLAAAGAGMLIYAFAQFVIDGRGTPAPPAPTERLVVSGLYRHLPQSMYLALPSVIAGQWY